MSAKEVMWSSVYLCVCLFICQQDYTKRYRRIWLKFQRKVRFGPA